MQNKKNIIPIIITVFILLLSDSTFLQAQVKIVLKPGAGVRQFDDNNNQTDQGTVDFSLATDSSTNLKRPVFHWCSTEQKTIKNNMILDDKGMLILGSEDPCVNKYDFYDATDCRLYIKNGSAHKTDGIAWINTSDKRLKKNIKQLGNSSLDLLKKVNVYEFEYKSRSGKKQLGIMAQEMQQLLPRSVGTFKKGKEEYLNFNASDLLYHHIKATQELATKLETTETELKNAKTTIQSLTEKVQDLNEQYNKLLQLLSQQQTPHKTKGKTTGLHTKKAGKGTQTITQTPSKKPIPTTVLEQAQLFQNQPNPFYETTTIRYFLPQKTKQAKLVITDATGKNNTQIPIINRGKGSLQFNARQYQLSTGSYWYNLFADGQKIATKQLLFVD